MCVREDLLKECVSLVLEEFFFSFFFSKNEHAVCLMSAKKREWAAFYLMRAKKREWASIQTFRRFH